MLSSQRAIFIKVFEHFGRKNKSFFFTELIRSNSLLSISINSPFRVNLVHYIHSVFTFICHPRLRSDFRKAHQINENVEIDSIIRTHIVLNYFLFQMLSLDEVRK